MPRLITGRLVVATHNPGKLREMRQLLVPYAIEAVSAGELGLAEPDETGSTFAANAALKAEAACRASGLPAFADDTGFCVVALADEPGIYSARFAKEAGGYAEAIAALRHRLETCGASPPHRAFFVSALALARRGEPVFGVEDRVDGILVLPPRGTLGFGYDAAFKPDGYERTFGEMTAIEKHGMPADGSRALSHRARAFQRFARMALAD